MKKKNLATAMAAAMAVSAVAPVVAHADYKKTDVEEAREKLKQKEKEYKEAYIKAFLEDNETEKEDTNKTKLDGTALQGLTKDSDLSDKSLDELDKLFVATQTLVKDYKGTEKTKMDALKDDDVKDAEKKLNAAIESADKANKAEEMAKKADKVAEIALAVKAGYEKNDTYRANGYEQALKDKEKDIDKAKVYDDAKAEIQKAKNYILAEKVKDNNKADASLANGLKVEVKEYEKVMDTNGTLETKDDKLKLKEGQEVIYSEGKLEKLLADTNVKYVVGTKMSEKELKSKEADIKGAKEAVESQEKDKKEKLEMTFGNENIYKVDEELSKEFSGFNETKDKYAKVTVLVNENADKNKQEKYVVYATKNEKMDSNIENANDEKTKIDNFEKVIEKAIKKAKEDENEALVNKLTAENEVIVTFEKLTNDDGTVIEDAKNANQPQLAKYNQLLLVLDNAYAGKDIKVESSEKVEEGHLVKTIEYKDGKNVLGRIVIRGIDIYNKEYANKVVRVSEVKDLKELEGNDISYAKEAVMDALYNGQLKGDENKNLNLKSNIKRAEFAKLLVELKGFNLTKKLDKEAVKKDKKEFTDVAKDAWYHDYVVTLQNQGIVNGDGDGKFRPEDTITRQEVAVMIANTLAGDKAPVDKFDEKNGEAFDTITSFADDDAIAIWADASVRALNEAGITKGYKVKNNVFEFRAEKEITRAEALVMLNRSFDGKKVNAAGQERTKEAVVKAVIDGKKELKFN